MTTSPTTRRWQGLSYERASLLNGQVFVALFSGINVGGKRMVKMAELRSLLGKLGFADIATYLQSGNAVFRADGDAATIAGVIEAAFEKEWGLYSRVMARDIAWLTQTIANNPYAEIAGDPTKLHAYVLERAPTADEVARLTERCVGPERFEVRSDVLYLHAPDGIGRSQFAGLIPRVLKVPGTARNWRTMLALQDLTGPADQKVR
jgi:uncharacterized protein (DUF1697 family)